jgi:hypothetical protein
MTPAALFAVLQPKLAAAGLYLAIDRQILMALCEGWALAERARQQLAHAPEADHAVWRALGEQMRLHARALAAKFLLIAEDRVPLAELDAEGRDVALVRIFDPARPLRVVTLTREQRENLEAWNAHAVAAGAVNAKGRHA